jgi:hypothetical protein
LATLHTTTDQLESTMAFQDILWAKASQKSYVSVLPQSEYKQMLVRDGIPQYAFGLPLFLTPVVEERYLKCTDYVSFNRRIMNVAYLKSRS